MPDLWTTNPEKLRDVLQRLGAKCGAEPRVLKPRDPEWTCHADFEDVRYDVYIHSIFDGSFPYLTQIGSILLIVGIFSGLVWGRWFWRPVTKRSESPR